MGFRTTTRSLMVWATMASVIAGTSCVVQAQVRLMRPIRQALVRQVRRGSSGPSRTTVTETHNSSSAGVSGSHPSIATPNLNSGRAPVERRTAPPTQTRAFQPTSVASPAPAAQNRFDSPKQAVTSERKDIPMASANNRPGSGRGGEHLSEWMNQHSNLSPAQQQQALEREPGFRELPQKTQQRLRDQLTQLNNMPPQQRARWVARTEAMEKLTPDQRAQVRGAMQQLASLPPDQRGPVQRSFRQLRDLPPDQRAAAMSSERYSGQFNSAQRATLNNLMRIEPMLEPPEPRQPTR